MKKNLFDSFMKIVVAVVVVHGLLCVTASYILAFIGKEVIAENLSSTVITEIMAPIVAYAIKSTLENISKYNNWVKLVTDNEEGEGEE